MPAPPLVASNQVISAAHINAIRNSAIAWPVDVDAQGHNLSNVGAITTAFLTVTTKIRTESVAPLLELYETDGPSNAKLWKVYADGGALFFTSPNDADTSTTNWMVVNRSGHIATAVTFNASINTTGSAGIGTTSPGVRLDVRAITNGVDTVRIGNTDGSKFLLFVPERATDIGEIGYWKGSAYGTILFRGQIKRGDTPTFADNAAAIAGGLSAGTEYKTPAGVKMEVF